MKHIMHKGNNNNVIITLHGTGGSATDLFGIADMIDSEAIKIGFQGNVNENGLSRYFARYPGGGFDLESLAQASKDLYDSIHQVIKDYNLKKHRITLIGYSNGANLAKDLLKEYVDLPLSNIYLFHPSPITPDKEFKKHEGLNILLTSGKNDPYISEDQFQKLEQKMIQAGMKVVSLTHHQGHQLVQDEIDISKQLYKGSDEDE